MTWRDDDERLSGLLVALVLLGPAAMAVIDGVASVPALESAVETVLGELARVTKIPMDVLRTMLRPAIQSREVARPPAAPAPGPAPARWQDLVGTLTAAKGAAPVTLVLRSGRRVRVIVRDVQRRGHATLILTEEVDGGVAQSLRLDEIAAIVTEPPPRARWIPAPGEAPPPGHAPCPCGNGEKHRRCCRDAAG